MSDAHESNDDPSVPDDAELWRRIPFFHWVRDDRTPDGRRVSSAAFDDEEMSVVIAAECHGGLDTLLHDHPRFGVASFTAEDARALGWGVVRAPTQEMAAHAHVMGRKSKKQRQQLASVCRILRAPQPDEP